MHRSLARIVAIVAGSIVAASANTAVHAHDIKVFANKFHLAEGQTKATVYLCWGHLMPVDDLIDGKTIERYELVTGSGSVTALKTDDRSLQANAVQLTPGINQIAVSRKVSVISYVLDAEGNKQLKRLPKSAIKEGKVESSQRSVMCGKALVTSGPDAAQAVKALGQRIEIMPIEAPGRWRAGEALRYQVLLDGQPLANAKVDALRVSIPATEGETISAETDAKGIATLKLGSAGVWALKANSREPAAGTALQDYDFTSYTATLTFEVRP